MVYVIITDDLPATTTMRCISKFGPHQLPEVDDWRYLTLEQAMKTHKPPMKKILKRVLF